ncbi:MAG: Hsp20/alpha crystallin family protein [Nitrososphaeria archaeon]|nr:Hsp20/alpha crystallin family protein [Nitrososphaeria archaeon]
MSDDFDIWFNRRKKYFEDFFKVIDKIFDETYNQYDSDDSNEDVDKFNEIGPLFYGYSITIGPDGKPVIREFGNLNSRKRFSETKEKELIVDVFERNNEIRIIAEVPGVSEEDIKLELSERILSIKVKVGNEEKYVKNIPLPSKVDPATLKSSYKNGILEISIMKLL